MSYEGGPRAWRLRLLPTPTVRAVRLFWSPSNSESRHAFFADAGITVRRVLTDNGSCYRSHVFKDAFGPAIAHKRTRPYLYGTCFR